MAKKSFSQMMSRIQLTLICSSGGLLLKIPSRAHVFLYRRTKGLIGGGAAGLPVLLLTTSGRKSGKRRTVPLGYLVDGSDYVLTGSNAGQHRDPAWSSNLRANPQATIEVKGALIPVVAEGAGPQDRSRLWAELIDRAPIYDGYQHLTVREIPMVVLRPQS